jgi:hypothetical protein
LIELYREGGYPTVTSHTGDWVIDPSTHSLLWVVPRVSSNDETKTGTLEFSVGGDDAAAFFPVKVNFTGLGSLIGLVVRNVFIRIRVPTDVYFYMQVSSVTAQDSEDQVKFSQEATVVAEDFVVV